ncbi:MAG: peptide chain release factor-like protein [Candidatus Omnitrophica bacterium]|nr:peptide chain release factor-like protein [Candidatus Omnitrophota bacterium]
MYQLPVSEAKRLALKRRMEKCGVREADLEESFIRSSGPGGQNVNKVSTQVQLAHRPTGITVKCQRERSQALNRYLARVLLVSKIEQAVLGRESEERKRTEKIRRQKRRRSKRAKEKMLKEKRHRSEKKGLRRSPDVEEW